MNHSPQTNPRRPTSPAWLPDWFFRERCWIGFLAAMVTLLVLLYIRFAFLLGMNHDEVEHAHVAFRILSGELPYRDFYQNHWPAYWLPITQFVQAFPFSIKAILAGRLLSLLALMGCWWLGLRWLAQIPGGGTKVAVLAYTTAVVALAHSFEFYMARPDPLMTLFCTAGLCLVPARGALGNARAAGLGILSGMAVSLSSKVLPLVLVVPLLVTFQASRTRSLRPLIAGVSYAAGCLLAVLPTAMWLLHHGLFEAFYFDVFALNLAVHKSWTDSFGLLSVAVFMPSLLGMLAWAWTRSSAPERDENGFLVVFLALLCGVLLAFIARHASLYNLQALTVPVAVGFAGLVSFLWLHGRGLGNRLLIVAALLAYPLSYTLNLLAVFKGHDEISQRELRQVMDLARPGHRTCVAFSPVHPVFCKSVSELSTDWDLTFTWRAREPRQLERFQRIWHEGIERTLKVQPDIILRSMPHDNWERAEEQGLIRRDQLDALDSLKPAYEVRIIGDYEFWVRQPQIR